MLWSDVRPQPTFARQGCAEEAVGIMVRDIRRSETDEYDRLAARDTGGESNLLMGMPIVENLHGCAGLSRRARYLYGGIFFALASVCLRCSFAYHVHVMAQGELELGVARSPHDMGSSMGG